MDKIQKLLKKLTEKEFTSVKEAIENVLNGCTKNLDIKKMSGHKDLYRVRIQSIRIIFLKVDEDIEILEISRRSEKTYKKY